MSDDLMATRKCAEDDCRFHIPPGETHCTAHGGRGTYEFWTDAWGETGWRITLDTGEPLIPHG